MATPAGRRDGPGWLALAMALIVLVSIASYSARKAGLAFQQRWSGSFPPLHLGSGH